MRYILIRKKTVLLDQETGTRWYVPPEIADLFDKKKVAEFKLLKSWKDPIPLHQSVKRGIQVTQEYYASRKRKRR